MGWKINTFSQDSGFHYKEELELAPVSELVFLVLYLGRLYDLSC